MPARDYLIGLALLGVTLGAAGAASEVVRRRRLAHLRGPERVLAQVLVATAALIAIHLVPLALGVLARGTAAAAALLVLAASLLVAPVPPERGPAAGAPAAGPSRPAATRVAAALALAALAGLAVVSFLRHADAVTQAPDLVSFDLPIVARWIQTASAWHITELFPLQTHGTYPHNAHVLVLATMLPFHNDAFLSVVVYPFLGVATLAVYALARELGAPGPGAGLVAAATASVPVVATSVEFAPLDTIGMGLFACGLLFLVREARTGRRADLVLAGLGLGLALGSKWYTATAVGAVVVVWGVMRLAARRPLLRDGAVMAAAVAAAGGFWLLRNLVEAGDPVYPQRVAVAGLTLFDAPDDLYRRLVGFSLAHYLGDWALWRKHILPDFRHAFGAGGAFLAAAGGAAAALVAVRAAGRRGPRPEWVAGELAVWLPVLVAVYLVTPYSAFGPEGFPVLTSANTRYAMPALVVAAGLCGWLMGHVPRLRAALEALAFAVAVQGVNAAARDLSLPRFEVALAAAALVLAGIAVPAARRRGLAVPAPAAAAAATAAVLAVAGGGWTLQRHLNDGRYRGTDPTFDWVAAYAPGGHRIGLAGYWDFEGLSPAWPLFGRRLGNDLAFVGVRDGGQLRQFGAPAAWARAARAYDLVLVARTRSPFPPRADETRWAAAAGLRPVAASERFVLFRVPGRRVTS